MPTPTLRPLLQISPIVKRVILGLIPGGGAHDRLPRMGCHRGAPWCPFSGRGVTYPLMDLSEPG